MATLVEYIFGDLERDHRAFALNSNRRGRITLDISPYVEALVFVQIYSNLSIISSG